MHDNSEDAADPDAEAALREALRELIPWATWPWQQCRAVAVDEYGRYYRCELRKRHDQEGHGHHRAERGMYDVLWLERVTTESR